MRRSKGKKAIREVAVSEFKAKCLSLLQEVRKAKTPLRVTRRGQPIADVFPPSGDIASRDWIGAFSESMEITGDVVSPVIEMGELEALEN